MSPCIMLSRSTVNAVIAVIAAYLLGSIPFAYVIVKLRTSKDIRSVGSGNLGATNTLRAAGKAAALAVLIGDIGKGAAAVFLASRLSSASAVMDAAAVAAVLGHMRPIFLRSGGGKGGATGLGTLLVLAPAAAAMCVPIVVVVLAWTRYASLATIVAVAAAPFLVVLGQRLGWIHDASALLPAVIGGIAALIVIRHRSNLRRLWAGREPKLTERLKSPAS